jgi:hypothetical protein
MKKLLVVFITLASPMSMRKLDPVNGQQNKTSADTYVLTFDGIIEKTGMCIRSLLRMVVHCH